MLVSWNWLKDYVDLDMRPEEAAHRLSMSGLNHESSHEVDGDLAVDLEVTSNRPDCLGHIGVAREIAVLYERDLKKPAAEPAQSATPAAELAKVRIDCPELCYRYTARVIRGVKIGASPDWLAKRLRTIGVAAINNIVDITNYVLMECGQPLHAFDLSKLGGSEIIVREPAGGEKLVAIDHRTYELAPGMCVIADAQRPVALGGVMGGADTEVTPETKDLLVESAQFAPLSIRTTARRLNLHSPSSYRFERGVDPEGVDWASRRCSELILDLAGGELAQGVIDVGRDIPQREPIVLRLSQLKRVLGIDIDPAEVRRILAALGGDIRQTDQQRIELLPPSWRRDWTREIDLVEEAARIHGYEEIPEDANVPMAPSHRTDHDRVLAQVRHVLTASGCDEALTPSVTPHVWAEAFSPWTESAPLVCDSPMKGVLAEASQGLGKADTLRCSLVPSLLEAARINQSLANPVIELFETAKVYLPSAGPLPDEQWTLALVSGGDYFRAKGVIEQLAKLISPGSPLAFAPPQSQQALLSHEKSADVQLGGRHFGILGELSEDGLEKFGLRGGITIAELDLGALVATAELTPQHADQSPFPSIARDLNLIVDEDVLWSNLSDTVVTAAGANLELVAYQETYRDAKKDGPGKKRLLFSITLRSPDRTLTNEEADQVRQDVVGACSNRHGAVLLG